jgi:hypothetical protein
MIRILDVTTRPDDFRRETGLAGRPVRQATVPPIATTLRAIADAWREGLAACRQYEALRSSGVPHDRAVREALGLGLTSSEATPQAAPSKFANECAAQ